MKNNETLIKALITTNISFKTGVIYIKQLISIIN